MLEQAIRSLLRVRSRQEMEQAVLELVCRLTSARVAALYQGTGGSYRIRAFRGPGAAAWSEREGWATELAQELSGVRRLPESAGDGPGAQACVAAALPETGADGTLLLLGPRSDGEPHRASDLDYLERILDACAVALQNAARFDRLSSLVLLDPLTGCYNRRGFDEHLKVEFERARRYRRPLSLLVMDIDHFKHINDTFDHTVGDAVLRRVGEVLRAEFRSTDFVCRFGGDEFAVIFPETTGNEVRRLAERLRVRIAALYPTDPLPTTLTASLGIASLPRDADDPDALLRAADQALYRAKAAGRNRVASV